MRLQVVGIIMIASNQVGTGNDETLAVSVWQDIGSLSFLAALIGNRLAAFLGNGMTAIQIELR